LSPRAILSLARAARAWAWLDGRDFVTPDDVQAVFSVIAGHRLINVKEGTLASNAAEQVLSAVNIP
jgi:MoxR-like ATPase